MILLKYLEKQAKLSGYVSYDELAELPAEQVEEAKQQAVKTGTDANFLSKSCFSGAHTRTNTNTSGKKNIGSVQKTQLSIDNEGAEQTHNPLVAGSNPTGPNSHSRLINQTYLKSRRSQPVNFDKVGYTYFIE